MECDLDGVRLHPDDLSDLARGEIGAVTERDELALALVERGDGLRDLETPERIVLEIARRGLVLDIGLGETRRTRRLGDAPPCDADQPRNRVAFPRVVALAVPERPLERVARDVLGLHTRPDPVGDVRVDATDQR